MTDFEQTVLLALGRLEERSKNQEDHAKAQSVLLQSLQDTGCARGHADRADIATLQREQSKLWKYARAMQAPSNRLSRAWGAIGTIIGAAAATIASWLSAKYGGGQ